MNTRDIAFVSEFPETDTTEFEVSNVSAFTATAPATTDSTGRELRCAVGLSDLCGCSHRLLGRKRETEVSKESLGVSPFFGGGDNRDF